MGFPPINPVLAFILADFLSRYGLTASFMINLKKYHNNPELTINQYIHGSMALDIMPKDFIKRAFMWEDSSQGDDFWQTHQDNWISFLTRLNTTLGDR